jgi:hypothetical protein
MCAFPFSNLVFGLSEEVVALWGEVKLTSVEPSGQAFLLTVYNTTSMDSSLWRQKSVAHPW